MSALQWSRLRSALTITDSIVVAVRALTSGCMRHPRAHTHIWGRDKLARLLALEPQSGESDDSWEPPPSAKRAKRAKRATRAKRDSHEGPKAKRAKRDSHKGTKSEVRMDAPSSSRPPRPPPPPPRPPPAMRVMKRLWRPPLPPPPPLRVMPPPARFMRSGWMRPPAPGVPSQRSWQSWP